MPYLPPTNEKGREVDGKFSPYQPLGEISYKSNYCSYSDREDTETVSYKQIRDCTNNNVNSKELTELF